MERNIGCAVPVFISTGIVAAAAILAYGFLVEWPNQAAACKKIDATPLTVRFHTFCRKSDGSIWDMP